MVVVDSCSSFMIVFLQERYKNNYMIQINAHRLGYAQNNLIIEILGYMILYFFYYDIFTLVVRYYANFLLATFI